MDGRARASSGELDFKWGNDATAGLKRRAQVWPSCRCDRKGLEPNKAGLLDFHRDNVAIRRKPRRLRLKRGERMFAELLEPRKRLVHRDRRFPAHKECGGGREPRRTIRLLGRINRW